jgi:Fic family protein
MSYKPPYLITSKMVNLIAEISDEVTRLEFSEESVITPRLRKKNRIKTLAGTLEIEGNLLGEEKITAILEGKRVLGTVSELTEVEGAIAAYNELASYSFDSQDHLLSAHKVLMNGILKTAGQYRRVQLGVGKHNAPPAPRVPLLMADLFEWLKDTEEHPLIKSSVFHYEFEFIHPFSDGNGRIGRLWQTVILYHWRNVFSLIPTESIVRDRQQEYYQALEDAGKNGDSSVFIEFMLTAILDAVKSSVKSSVKSLVKTDDRILVYFRENPTGTVVDLASSLELTTRASSAHG